MISIEELRKLGISYQVENNIEFIDGKKIGLNTELQGLNTIFIQDTPGPELTLFLRSLKNNGNGIHNSHIRHQLSLLPIYLISNACEMALGRIKTGSEKIKLINSVTEKSMSFLARLIDEKISDLFSPPSLQDLKTTFVTTIVLLESGIYSNGSQYLAQYSKFGKVPKTFFWKFKRIATPDNAFGFEVKTPQNDETMPYSPIVVIFDDCAASGSTLKAALKKLCSSMSKLPEQIYIFTTATSSLAIAGVKKMAAKLGIEDKIIFIAPGAVYSINPNTNTNQEKLFTDITIDETAILPTGLIFQVSSIYQIQNKFTKLAFHDGKSTAKQGEKQNICVVGNYGHHIWDDIIATIDFLTEANIINLNLDAPPYCNRNHWPIFLQNNDILIEFIRLLKNDYPNIYDRTVDLFEAWIYPASI